MNLKSTLIFLLVLLSLFLIFLTRKGFMMFSQNYYESRLTMIETQLKPRGISNDKVLEAMLKVERHRFVPDAYKHMAYNDRPLPIGEGQTISQPYIVALMSECITSDCLTGEIFCKQEKSAPLKKQKLKILEIGTGSGYQAAVLGELSHEVYTIEIIESLGRRAETLLLELGYKDVFVKIGDGYRGWPEKAPFDRIIVTCAPEEAPPALLDQLDPSGGRMIIPVGQQGGTQKLFLIKRNGTDYIKEFVTYVMFVPMVKSE